MSLLGVRLLEKWHGVGLFPRLILSVVLVILCAASVRSYLLLMDECANARDSHRERLREVRHFLVPLLAEQLALGDYAAAQRLLDVQVRERADIAYADWRSGAAQVAVRKTPTEPPRAPEWFLRYADIPALEEDMPVDVDGVSHGVLRMGVDTAPAIGRVWQRMMDQVKVFFAAVFIISLLSALVLRGNLKALRQLARAADRFRNGDYAVRVIPRGASETRLAAQAFNSMADEVQSMIQSLARSERKFRAVFDQTFEFIGLLDKDGLLLEINQRALETEGSSAAAIVSKPFWESPWWRDRPREQARGREAVERAAQGETVRFEAGLRSPSGEFLAVDFSLKPVLDERGGVAWLIIEGHDVTARKRNQLELQRAKVAAEQASAAKSEFLSRMSHELRTPLNAILGFAQLMECDEESPLPPMHEESVKHILDSGWQLLSLVNEVLDLSCIEAGKMDINPEAAELGQLLEECLAPMLPLAADRGIRINNGAADGVGRYVWMDPVRLRQVMLNLLSNAVKFNRDGGTVRIECSHAVPGMLRLSISDSGMGIPEERLDELFIPFNRLGAEQSEIQGAGVGLAVVKRLVELQGGEIGVTSQAGEGATFWVDLPEAPAPEDGADNPVS